MFQEIILRDLGIPVRQRHHEHCGPYRWRPAEPGKGRGFYQSSRGLACDRHGSPINLRLEWANDSLARGDWTARTTGYFCDPHGYGDTLQPIIARLPNRRGFLAGWTMGEGMAACLDGTVYPDAVAAAYAAHSIAENDAERSREEQENDDDDD